MEPMNAIFPNPGYLEDVRQLTSENGIILIFDEICTGLRLALGGAQEYFGVTPDLSVFGKGIGNGYPIAAVVGSRRIMSLSTEVFFSGTFGGEALSLVACKSVLEFFQKNSVVDDFQKKGKKIIDGVTAIVNDNDMGHVLSVSGHPSWSFMNIKGTQKYQSLLLKTLFLQEMFKRGSLILSSHNINFSHTDLDIEQLLLAYSEVVEQMKSGLKLGKIEDQLNCKPLKNIFSVR